MRYRLLLLLALPLLCAWPSINIGGGEPAAASGQVIEIDWEDTWANYSAIFTNFGSNGQITSGALNPTTGTAHSKFLYTSVATDDSSQYCVHRVGFNATPGNNNYVDCLFRGEGVSATHDYLRVGYDPKAGSVFVRPFQGITPQGAGSYGDVTCAGGTSDGGWVGMAIDGTGESTYIAIWDETSLSNGATPTGGARGYTAWGTPDCCLGFSTSAGGICTGAPAYTDMGTEATEPIPTGTRIGVGTLYNSGGTDFIFIDHTHFGDAI